MIFENGHLLVEGERFSFQPQLKVTQIDIDRLRTERHTNSTFINAQREARAEVIECKGVELPEFQLLRSVNPHPFIEILEYSHPGMYHRISYIREASS